MTYTSKSLLLGASALLAIAGTSSAQMSSHEGHDMKQAGHDRSSHMVEALATVTAILADDDRISLSHGAIHDVSWPAATMKFPVGANVTLSEFQPGDRVQFTLHRAPNGALPLVELCKTTSEAVQPGLCASPKRHMKMAAGMAGHENMDHSKMDHAKMKHENMDHEEMNHGKMEHHQMDHSKMATSKMDHAKMGHENMDHAKMDNSSMERGNAQSTQVSATGKVLKIDSAARTLRIKHDPIPAISWPVMTMVFEAGDGVDLTNVSQGEDIEFAFDPNGEDGYIISAISSASSESDHSAHGDH